MPLPKEELMQRLRYLRNKTPISAAAEEMEKIMFFIFLSRALLILFGCGGVVHRTLWALFNFLFFTELLLQRRLQLLF
jgi:hypothetical protein